MTRYYSRPLVPICIYDGFFSNPDAVVDYAMKQEYFPTDGNYPGLRSKFIAEINNIFFQSVCNKILSIFYDFTLMSYKSEISMQFHKIPNQSYNKNLYGKENSGWIHRDDRNAIMTAIIYLNKNEDSYGGTSFYKPIDPNDNPWLKKEKEYLELIKSHYHENKIENIEYYNNEKNNYEKQFKKTLEIKNIYNRLVILPADVWHSVDTFTNNFNEDRLTIITFINSLESTSRVPSQRIEMYPEDRWFLNEN